MRTVKAKGLRNFRYFDVKEDFQLSLESSHRSYFATHICNEKTIWNGKSIKDRFATKDGTEKPSKPAYDSGVICIARMPGEDVNVISSMKGFIAPYQLMNVTIARLAHTIEKYKDECVLFPKKSTQDEESLKTQRVPPNEIAVAIGMVLAIVATKGSAEKGNRLPYLLLTQRTNVKLRNNQLDAPVVEGLNYGDIDSTGIIKLESVAKRALAEERGVNCEMLEERGLLHLPKCYYLGYDTEYHQWNFFGTVVIDCTVEEIVREGCYFTKDKFESKNIIAIPLNTKLLSYHLSQTKIKVAACGQAVTDIVSSVSTKMWETARASIFFAIKDFQDDSAALNENKPKTICQKLQNSRQFCKEILNRGASFVDKKTQIFNTMFFMLSFVLLFITVVWLIGLFICKKIIDGWSIGITVISSLITFGTCLIVASMQRTAIARGDDILFVRNQSGTNDIPEISVFRGVTLIDGNIAEKERHVSFSIGQESKNSQFSVMRKCNVFDVFSETEDETWILKRRADICPVIEHMNWQIHPGSKKNDDSFRVIIPCVIDEVQIRLRQSDDKLEHMIDVEIPYNEFRSQKKWGEDEIEMVISKKVYEQKNAANLQGQSAIGNNRVDCGQENQDKIKYRLLLCARNKVNGKQQYVIVGFVDRHDAFWISEDLSAAVCHSLTYDLTSTLFAQRFKDDVTRVVCEYAIADYVGYQMSVR